MILVQVILHFNYIKQLPLDIIKVDKTFIDDIVEDDYAQAFIKLIVDLSKTIGTKIVVEVLNIRSSLNCLKVLVWIIYRDIILESLYQPIFLKRKT